MILRGKKDEKRIIDINNWVFMPQTYKLNMVTINEI